MSLVSIARAIDTMIEAIGRAVAWLSLVMVLTGVLVVTLRYGFDAVYAWMQELMTYLHAAVFLVGGVYLVQYDGHVRVGIFYDRFAERTRAWVDVATMLGVVVPLAILLHWTSFDYVVNSWRMLESSSHSGGLPTIFLLKTYIWAFADLLLLSAIARALHRIAELRGTAPAPGGAASGGHAGP